MEIKLNPHARVEIRSVPSADIIDQAEQQSYS